MSLLLEHIQVDILNTQILFSVIALLCVVSIFIGV